MLNILKGYYWLTVAGCGLVGVMATSILTQAAAVLAVLSAWILRELIEGMCKVG